jgi:hypothetical protein
MEAGKISLDYWANRSQSLDIISDSIDFTGGRLYSVLLVCHGMAIGETLSTFRRFILLSSVKEARVMFAAITQGTKDDRNVSIY